MGVEPWIAAEDEKDNCPDLKNRLGWFIAKRSSERAAVKIYESVMFEWQSCRTLKTHFDEMGGLDAAGSKPVC